MNPEVSLQKLSESLKKLGVAGFNEGASKQSFPLGRMIFVKGYKFGRELYYAGCDKSKCITEMLRLHVNRFTVSADSLPILQRMGFEIVIKEKETQQKISA